MLIGWLSLGPVGQSGIGETLVTPHCCRSGGDDGRTNETPRQTNRDAEANKRTTERTDGRTNRAPRQRPQRQRPKHTNNENEKRRILKQLFQKF